MFEIGTTLREARARRKLSYDQVEAETKIRAKYVRALEDEEFDVLPSGTYVKGFLRTYAEYLGLNGQLYVDEYNSRYGDAHPEDAIFRRRERAPAPRRQESSNAVLVGLAGIVAVAVLFFAAWRWGGSPDEQGLAVPSIPTQEGSGFPGAPTNERRVPDPETQTTGRPRKRRPVVPATVELTVYASGGRSWVEIRKGSSGPRIFGDVLDPAANPKAGKTRFKQGFTIYNVPNPTFLRV